MVSSAFLRFCLVGIINTAVDVPLFVLLHNQGLPILFANIISTSAALTVSFILNHNFTFKAGRTTRYQIVLYIAVTLLGLWALQPLVISGLLVLNDHFHYIEVLTKYIGHGDILESAVPKIASIAVTLVWNFLWYSKVIFPATTYYKHHTRR